MPMPNVRGTRTDTTRRGSLMRPVPAAHASGPENMIDASQSSVGACCGQPRSGALLIEDRDAA
eukprot:CAMPEP_0197901192 /NCGR_PEP_ID=MMETSP1439-20131203/50875_1 /TAXON_ID=66791 /ORGANISM="Gonyaulax spinifera, Strain CCMP409" /LENGTH=62 /DNA_ID=CAMNT_0043522153 /DNA_START=36 /DNA_END=220 /DNA_ORIENTATION=-